MYFYLNNIPIYLFNEYKNFTIIQFCDLIYLIIPRFCYHNKLSIAGNCRMCMVELSSSIKPIIACATNLMINVDIYTDSLFVKKARENVLEFLLINHPLDCPICDQAGECDLQDQSLIYGSDRGRFKEMKRSVEDKEMGPVIKTIMTRCIHCTRCIRFSDEISNIKDLGMIGRGNNSEIKMINLFFYDSEISGNIVDVCPVGALTLKPYAFTARPWELKSIESIDILDSLHSNIRIDLKGNRILRILPKKNERLNEEWISDFCRFSYESIQTIRIKFPYLLINNIFNLTNISIRQSWEQCFEFIKYLFTKHKFNNFNFFTNSNIGLFNISLFYFYHKFFFNSSFFIENIIKSNIDFRNSYFCNSFNELINSNFFLIYNLNLKENYSVLNARITRYLNNNLLKKYFFYIGNNIKHTYFIYHLGNSVITLFNLLRGKSFSNNYFNLILKKNLNFIYFFNNSNLFDYLNKLFFFDNINCNNLSFYSNLTGYFELGINNDNITKLQHLKNNDFNTINYYYKTENILNENKNNFSIYHGFNMPENIENSNFLYLPSTTSFEQEDTYINIFGDSQNTQQILDFSEQEEIKSDFYIFKNILFSFIYLNISSKHNFISLDLLLNELIFFYFNYFCLFFDVFPLLSNYNKNSFKIKYIYSNYFINLNSLNLNIKNSFFVKYSITLQQFYNLRENKKINSFI